MFNPMFKPLFKPLFKLKTDFNQRQAGFSLIEVMIALTLSLIIGAGLFQIFTSSQRSTRVVDAISQTQEVGRIASEILGRSIRNADYWGCIPDPTDSSLFSNHLNANSTFDPTQTLRGLEVRINTSTTDDIVDGSAEITLRSLAGNNAVKVVSDPANTAASFQVNDNSTINDGDILLVANCQSADLFQANQVNTGAGAQVVIHNTGADSPGNASKSDKTYDSSATVYRPIAEAYRIRQAADGRRFLTLESGLMTSAGGAAFGAPVELVSNIANMQVQLGRDTNGDGSVDAWVAPGAFTTLDAFQEAIALRVSLLTLSDSNNVLASPRQYCYPSWLNCEADTALLSAGAPTDAASLQFVTPYTFTSTIRNRAN